MDAKGEPVAHAHDDRVGLVLFILAQMRKNSEMLVGGPDHERGSGRSCASSSAQRLAVAENLDPLPEFVTQRAEQAGFRAADARRLSAAEGSEGKGDLARFL